MATNTSFEPLAHSAEGIGPASLSLRLPAFAAAARGLPVTSVPQATADALASLSPQQRRLLERRLGLEKETEASSSVLRIESHRVDFESWQRSRLLAGSDDDAAIANAQNVLLISQSHMAPEKQQAREQAEGSQPPKKRRKARQPSAAKLNSRFELSVQARTPTATAECVIRPPADRIPSGLRMYRPFAESHHYMRRTRPGDSNTFVTMVRFDAQWAKLTWQVPHPRSVSSLHQSPSFALPVADALPAVDDDSDTLIANVSWHAIRTNRDRLETINQVRHQRVSLPTSFTLADLRDTLICPSDTQSHPVLDRNGVQTWSRPQKCGGVFMIERTLHADTREGLDDYAAMIQPQAETVKPTVPEAGDRPSTTALTTWPAYEIGSPMHTTRLAELPIRAGQPYWYVHQGSCEHVFTFDDVRARHTLDPATTNGDKCPYPVHTMLSRYEQWRCRLCARDPATMYAIDDPLAGESPAMLCDSCLWHLHGDGGDLGEGAAEDETVPERRAAQLEQARATCRDEGCTIVPLIDELEYTLLPRIEEAVS